MGYNSVADIIGLSTFV